MAELWTLLTENPATFKGGGIWRIMVNINDALTAIAYGLLVLFFAAGIIKTCGSFTDLKKPEHVLKAFIRFALAQGSITYGMDSSIPTLSILSTISVGSSVTLPAILEPLITVVTIPCTMENSACISSIPYVIAP